MSFVELFVLFVTFHWIILDWWLFINRTSAVGLLLFIGLMFLLGSVLFFLKTKNKVLKDLFLLILLFFFSLHSLWLLLKLFPLLKLKLFNTFAHWSLPVKENFHNFTLQIVAREETRPLSWKVAFYWKSVFLTSTSHSQSVFPCGPKDLARLAVNLIDKSPAPSQPHHDISKF